MTQSFTTPLTEKIWEEDIARRAFELYEARGCQSGHDVEDWLEAERELQEEQAVLRAPRAASSRS
jgi:hypothetical protein